MNSYDRNLIFDVAGGVAENLPFIHQIHAGFKRGTQMLEYLRRNRIIGKSFQQWAKDHGGSKLRMGSYILKRIESVDKRPIFTKDLT